MRRHFDFKAFLSEVDAGSREENASIQESRVRFLMESEFDSRMLLSRRAPDRVWPN
jgi:hypothetical protein